MLKGHLMPAKLGESNFNTERGVLGVAVDPDFRKILSRRKR